MRPWLKRTLQITASVVLLIAAGFGAILYSVVGGKVVQQGAEDAIVPALVATGMNRHWAELYQEMTHALDNGHTAWEGGRARFVRGTTEIDAVLSRLVKGSRSADAG